MLMKDINDDATGKVDIATIPFTQLLQRACNCLDALQELAEKYNLNMTLRGQQLGVGDLYN